MELLKQYWLRIPVALYFIGLLIHNSYLSQFGSYDFQPLNIQYIMTGLGLVVFMTSCFLYLSIKVNLSYIPETLSSPKKWNTLSRASSLPYLCYFILRPNFLNEITKNDLIIKSISLTLIFLASLVMFISISSIFDEEGYKNAKIMQFILKYAAIPLTIGLIIMMYYFPDLKGIAFASLYPLLGMGGLAMAQSDRKHNVDFNILQENSKPTHELTAAIGVLFLSVISGLYGVVGAYSKYIYTALPVGYGGAKTEHVHLYHKNKYIDAKLIQTGPRWILYKNIKTGNIEQIKNSSVDKIIHVTPKQQQNAPAPRIRHCM